MGAHQQCVFLMYAYVAMGKPTCFTRHVNTQTFDTHTRIAFHATWVAGSLFSATPKGTGLHQPWNVTCHGADSANQHPCLAANLQAAHAHMHLCIRMHPGMHVCGALQQGGYRLYVRA